LNAHYKKLFFFNRRPFFFPPPAPERLKGMANTLADPFPLIGLLCSYLGGVLMVFCRFALPVFANLLFLVTMVGFILEVTAKKELGQGRAARVFLTDPRDVARVLHGFFRRGTTAVLVLADFKFLFLVAFVLVWIPCIRIKNIPSTGLLPMLGTTKHMFLVTGQNSAIPLQMFGIILLLFGAILFFSALTGTFVVASSNTDIRGVLMRFTRSGHRKLVIAPLMERFCFFLFMCGT